MDTKYKLHGAFSWCELLTTDVAEAKRFYSQLFGWTLEPAPIPDMEYTLVKYGGEKMGGIMTIPPAAAGLPPCWGVYVTVDDVDATAKLAVEMGGKVLMPPQDIPQVGRFCVLQDPQGAMINAITYAMTENGTNS
ncbi:MAG: VOC family protein [Gammaproteobacteria bacterium]